MICPKCGNDPNHVVHCPACRYWTDRVTWHCRYRLVQLYEAKEKGLAYLRKA
nr:MAG TPA: zinc-ribbon containing domain protein [Caudoviricetes sp.]